MNNAELLLTIYTRAECHLCEEMLDGLKRWQKHSNFKIKIVDIDQDTSLTDRYAVLIPVLAVDDIEICHHHLDANALSIFFKNRE